MDVAPAAAEVDHEGSLRITWNDGHRSTFSSQWLIRHSYDGGTRDTDEPSPRLWRSGFRPARFAYDAVVHTDEGQIVYLDALDRDGVAVVTDVPAVPGEVARFAEALGHVREVAFARIHDVRHDPAGYNVAHTSEALKPHSDMPSYAWPPSVQLLHFLVNEAEGGESVLVDGWAVLEDLRRLDPGAFETLTQVPVPFQLCSETEDTFAVAPLVQLDTDARVRTFRFSNQLALPLRVPFEQVEPFYAAYRRLGAMVDDERYRVTFKARAGDLVSVHGHRVLHGRLAYRPATGARHLQDVYMEWDDLMARRRVLRGEHRPLPAAERVAA